MVLENKVLQKMERGSRRIGIFSGTFDPVHKGHIAFALQALQEANLETIYFMPEAKPRRKEGITHYAHRTAMLEIALKPYKDLKILEVADKQFSVVKTMPKLKAMFKNDQLFLLLGSDIVNYLTNSEWPQIELLLKDFGLIVGLRGETSEESVRKQLATLPNTMVVVTTLKKHASSREIRQASASNEDHEDSLKGTKKYIKKNWLYDSVAGSAKRS